MIKKINVGNVNNQAYPQSYKDAKQSKGQHPAFGSAGLVDGLIKGVQLCEKHPMVNVSVLDLTSAIIPRTIIETYAGSKKEDENGNKYIDPNVYAGMEAFRREASGLVVNCLVPSFFALGLGHLLQKPLMGQFKNSNMANSWAGADFLDKFKGFYTKAEGNGSEKAYNTLKDMIFKIEGVDGNELKSFEELLKKDENFDDVLRKLSDAITSENPDKKTVKTLTKNLYKTIVEKTHISEHIKLNDTKFFSTNLESVCDDGAKLVQNLIKNNVTDVDKLGDYVKGSKNLVNAKSLGALGIIIPLAISMQPINRWLTRKASGKKGAPIYSDFKEQEHKELTPKQKTDLLAQKFVSISSMIGVALLSMSKIPTSLASMGKMLEFRGLFPTMDQARVISTATFASRMGASEDINELREATVRDIATFASLYFVGDYAAKGIATIMENVNKKKNPHVKLLNTLADAPDKTGNKLLDGWNSVKHWVKNTSLKSSDEIVTNAAENVTNGAKKVNNKNLRTLCQLGNLGFSLLILGIFIPLYNRTQTNKKREAENALKEMQTVTDAETTVDTAAAGAAKSKKTSFSSTYDFSQSILKDNKAFAQIFDS